MKYKKSSEERKKFVEDNFQKIVNEFIEKRDTHMDIYRTHNDKLPKIAFNPLKILQSHKHDSAKFSLLKHNICQELPILHILFEYFEFQNNPDLDKIISDFEKEKDEILEMLTTYYEQFNNVFVVAITYAAVWAVPYTPFFEQEKMFFLIAFMEEANNMTEDQWSELIDKSNNLDLTKLLSAIVTKPEASNLGAQQTR